MVRILGGSLIARLQLGMSAVALLLLAHADGFSFGVIGAALAAMGFGNALVAPLQGAIVDRTGQVPVLAVTAYCQGAALIVFALWQPRDPLAFVLLAAAVGMLVPPATACLRALLPTVAPERERRERLYALDAIGTELVYTAGPLLVAALVAIGSPALAVAAMALFSVAGATLYMTSAAVRAWRPPAHAERRPARSAMAVPGLALVIASIVLLGISMGGCQVALAALALDLGGGGLATVLLALWSVGSILGGLVYFRRRWSLAPNRRYPLLLALVAAGTAPLLAAAAVWMALPLALLTGVGLAPAVACQNGLIGELVPDGLLTEAFTWNTSAVYGGIAAGSGLGGWLVELAGFRGSAALAALAALFAASGAYSWRGRFTRPTVPLPTGRP